MLLCLVPYLLVFRSNVLHKGLHALVQMRMNAPNGAVHNRFQACWEFLNNALCCAGSNRRMNDGELRLSFAYFSSHHALKAGAPWNAHMQYVYSRKSIVSLEVFDARLFVELGNCFSNLSISYNAY